MLTISHVTKKYGKTAANRDISFSVGDGQIAVLLGPNGAGKSTMIKCIAGLLRYEGEITLDGHPNKSPEAKKLLGYVPEMPAIYDLLTVNEHMELMARAYRLENWEASAENVLKRLELWDKKDKLGRELSKGMQQKVSIACALIIKPKVMIFDEPLVGLDPHAIKELKAIFRELKEQNVSVLISTHMLDSVENDWDVAYIMVDGSFAATRRSEGIAAEGEKTLAELFFEITEGKGQNA